MFSIAHRSVIIIYPPKKNDNLKCCKRLQQYIGISKNIKCSPLEEFWGGVGAVLGRLSELTVVTPAKKIKHNSTNYIIVYNDIYIT